MDIEIKIGREVDGVNACRVPPTFTKVSRLHATLYWCDGIATLVDNSSSNGTFVNGRRITSCKVLENDIVWLGGNGTDDKCYKLDLRQLFATCNSDMTPKPQTPPVYRQSFYPQQDSSLANAGVPHGDDYSREFEQVKQAYIGYHDEMSKLTKKANTRMQLPRLMLSLIPTVIGLVIMLMATDMTMRIVGMSAGTVLSGVIGTLTMGKSSSKKEKLTEDILDLQLKYQKDYHCPKCGKQFNLELHWKKLQADGKCPYGCGAKYC